jgi:hypothetical protein
MRYEMSIGPKMHAVASYVSEHPGCTKVEAGRHAWLLNHGAEIVPNNDNIYNPVNRALEAGIIRAERTIRGYKLYVGGP